MRGLRGSLGRAAAEIVDLADAGANAGEFGRRPAERDRLRRCFPESAAPEGKCFPQPEAPEEGCFPGQGRRQSRTR